MDLSYSAIHNANDGVDGLSWLVRYNVYFGIGEKKLRSMIEDYRHLGLFIQNGMKYTIKRQKFEAFLNDAYAI